MSNPEISASNTKQALRPQLGQRSSHGNTESALTKNETTKTEQTSLSDKELKAAREQAGTTVEKRPSSRKNGRALAKRDISLVPVPKTKPSFLLKKALKKRWDPVNHSNPNGAIYVPPKKDELSIELDPDAGRKKRAARRNKEHQRHATKIKLDIRHERLGKTFSGLLALPDQKKDPKLAQAEILIRLLQKGANPEEKRILSNLSRDKKIRGSEKLKSVYRSNDNTEAYTMGTDDKELDTIHRLNSKLLKESLVWDLRYKVIVEFNKERLESWFKGFYQAVHSSLMLDGFIIDGTELSEDLLKKDFPNEKERFLAIIDFFTKTSEAIERDIMFADLRDKIDTSHFSDSQSPVDLSSDLYGVSSNLQGLLYHAGILDNDKYTTLADVMDPGYEDPEEIEKFRNQYSVSTLENGELHAALKPEFAKKDKTILYFPDDNPIRSVAVIFDALSELFSDAINIRGKLKLNEKTPHAWIKTPIERQLGIKNADPNAEFIFKVSDMGKFQNDTFELLKSQVSGFGPYEHRSTELELRKGAVQTIQDLRQFTKDLYKVLDPLIDLDIVAADAEDFFDAETIDAEGKPIKKISETGINFKALSVRDLLFLISSSLSRMPFDNEDAEDEGISQESINSILEKLQILLKNKKILDADIRLIELGDSEKEINNMITEYNEKYFNIQNLDHISKALRGINRYVFVDGSETSASLKALRGIAAGLESLSPLRGLNNGKITEVAKYFLSEAEGNSGTTLLKLNGNSSRGDQ